jgi:hypothetical protein
MQLWQIDLMSGVLLDDGTDLNVVTGIDDHSRFCVAAALVRRATSRSVCEVFRTAMLRYGVPDEVLTDIQTQLVLSIPGSSGRRDEDSRTGAHPPPLLDRSERAATPCLLITGWVGVTAGEAVRPVGNSVTGNISCTRIPVSECPERFLSSAATFPPVVVVVDGRRTLAATVGHRYRLSCPAPGESR